MCLGQDEEGAEPKGTLPATDRLALSFPARVHSLRQKLSHVTTAVLWARLAGACLPTHSSPAVLATELRMVMMVKLQGLSLPGTPSDAL